MCATERGRAGTKQMPRKRVLISFHSLSLSILSFHCNDQLFVSTSIKKPIVYLFLNERFCDGNSTKKSIKNVSFKINVT